MPKRIVQEERRYTEEELKTANSLPLSEEEKASFLSEYVAPRLAELNLMCMQRGISFIGVAEYPTEGGYRTCSSIAVSVTELGTSRVMVEGSLLLQRSEELAAYRAARAMQEMFGFLADPPDCETCPDKDTCPDAACADMPKFEKDEEQ